MGNVLQATFDIPTGSYISATAYDTDGNESAYSEEIRFDLSAIQPASGGQIYTMQIVQTKHKHGQGYDVQSQGPGKWLIILDSVNPGDTRTFRMQ